MAIAWKRSNKFDIGSSTIGDEYPVFLIAEIGINHNGQLELAKKLVDEAVKAGADCAKFQMRNLQSLYYNEGNSSNDREEVRSQYVLDLLARFQLAPYEMFDVFDYYSINNKYRNIYKCNL